MISQRDERKDLNAERLAQGLGWLSIALGLAEVAAPRHVARQIGAPEGSATDSVLRTMGARQITGGLAILSQPGDARWLWTRVGGDLVDLSCLGAAYRSEHSDAGRLCATTAAVLGVAAVDVIAARQLSRSGGQRTNGHGVRIEEAVTINRSIEEVYQFWRRFENLPRFMRHLESVERLDHRRSRWRAVAPIRGTVEWEAEIVQERENEWIAWRSLEGSDVQNSGSVRFLRAPGARGTEVRVQMQYSPPAGGLGRRVARLFGEEPQLQIKDDLHRFKQILETGEIPVSDGARHTRSAQPPPNPQEVNVLAGVHS